MIRGTISIHVLREEDDPSVLLRASARRHFYPRPPRGGRLGRSTKSRSPGDISIHVLREEDDSGVWRTESWISYISIHVLREEDDRRNMETRRNSSISIHVLREEDDEAVFTHVAKVFISIHVLREEDDSTRRKARGWPENFYPRPPRGGRLDGAFGVMCGRGISIHVLREEDDSTRSWYSSSATIFLSTSSARRTTNSMVWAKSGKAFLSTSSARRTTRLCRDLRDTGLYFYPRPPRGGRRFRRKVGHRVYEHFYPRPPRGGRPLKELAGLDED